MYMYIMDICGCPLVLLLPWVLLPGPFSRGRGERAWYILTGACPVNHLDLGDCTPIGYLSHISMCVVIFTNILLW